MRLHEAREREHVRETVRDSCGKLSQAVAAKRQLFVIKYAEEDRCAVKNAFEVTAVPTRAGAPSATQQAMIAEINRRESSLRSKQVRPIVSSR